MCKSYVLITPARNEAAYIEKTIESVIAQTLLPQKWVIVSDDSTDHTVDIVKGYIKDYDFIQLLHKESNLNRNFGSKVFAIQAGIRQLKDIEYDFIGNLDADISFESNYYEEILKEFQENPKLGIGGGIVFDSCKNGFRKQLTSPESVAGAVQLFRRQCYEDIGGYIPLEKGGIDAIAEVMARMNGWETKSLSHTKVFHHKSTELSFRNSLLSRFHLGIRDYSWGNHPLFEIAKCIWRLRRCFKSLN